ncbi:RING finger protein [Exophiala viscosa]|uniref:RBR-type E3 ubiquitin transferase n=1 Tax=Exophiala viscosa TaxID=2486360 RepID=A0AAN6E106_9EURO|nr:RING finger protein [Exophiala viscosa]
MEDDPGAAEDERTIELSSIAAIYPELVVDPDDPYVATLELAVTPVKPLRICFKSAETGAPPALLTPPTSLDQDEGHSPLKPQVQAIQLDAHELSHLPPLSLKVTLPEGYPTEKPPLVSVSVNPPWLPRPALKRLKEDCSNLWEELGKDQVVYAYIDHVQQEAENAFGLAGAPDFQVLSELKLALLDYDLKAKRDEFEKGTFDCGICLEPKKGVNCHKIMLCGHVFCTACLQEFYKSCITEGDVDNVKCLSPTCGKDEAARVGPDGKPLKKRKHDRTLNPSELLQIPIEQELVQRYVRLKRKKRLEADPNTIYCPRQWCQGAARSKKHPKPVDPMKGEESSESEEEPQQPTKRKKKFDLEELPMADRLSVCEDCNFAFCCVCRKGWHGELAHCSPRRQKELDEEESASLLYMQKYSTPCPTCNAPCQKTMGCNHMICFRCKTHFCYLCSSFLMPDNPYNHFNDLASQCYQRLWELEAGDGEGVDRQAFHNPELAEWDEIIEDEDSDDDDLPPENFDDFRGERPFEDEEDTSDEEPAPDQRRNMHIEIVNFARPGANNAHRIALPERPRAPEPAPPAVPNPPRRRRRGGGQRGNRHGPVRIEQARAVQNAPPPARQPAPQPPAQAAPAANNEPPILPQAAPGQGNHPGGAMQPGPVRAMGLERFLQLAQQDEEDEWDSDELDEDFDELRLAEPRRQRVNWR